MAMLTRFKSHAASRSSGCSFGLSSKLRRASSAGKNKTKIFGPRGLTIEGPYPRCPPSTANCAPLPDFYGRGRRKGRANARPALDPDPRAAMKRASRLLVVSMTDRKLLRLDPGAGRRDLGGLTEQCGGAAGARGDAAHPCVHARLRLHTARSRAGASSSRRSSFRRGFP